MASIGSRHRGRLVDSLVAWLGFFMAAYVPARADWPVYCPPDQAAFCGDQTCEIFVCAPYHQDRQTLEKSPKTFPPGVPCAGRQIQGSDWGLANPEGRNMLASCIGDSMPARGCRWKSGPPFDHRYDRRDQEMVCDQASANMPRPYPKEPAERTIATQDALVAAFTDAAGGDSGWAHAAISIFRNRYTGAKLAGPSGDTMGGQVDTLGRFLSAQMGVGTCKRHFYNNSDSSWGVGLVHAGSCHLEGQPSGNDAMCIVPHHQTAELEYSNTAMNNYTAQVVIAGPSNRAMYLPRPGSTFDPTFTQTFELDAVGCHIQGNIPSEYGTINEPADGDFKMISW